MVNGTVPLTRYCAFYSTITAVSIVWKFILLLTRFQDFCMIRQETEYLARFDFPNAAFATNPFGF